MATEHAPRVDLATEHPATERTEWAPAVEHLADQLRYAATEQPSTWPEEWADGADPADWEDYVAPAPGDTRLIATMWQDTDASVNDCDVWGRVSEYAYDYHASNESTRRPEWATGAARKIQVDRGSWVWWEPYREGRKVHNSPADVRQVRDLLECGFHGVTVERQTVGLCGHWHTADVSSLGGIDSLEGGCLAEVLAELIDEVAP